jgi:hypothetical protein
MERDKQADGIKKSIETIIGTNTVLKRKKKSEEDIHREHFLKIIQLMDELQVRSNILNVDLKLNFYDYDSKFYEIIDRMFMLQYGEDIAEIVFFYVYERLNPDGTINSLQDQEGNEIILNNPFELWNLVDKIKKNRK